LKLIPNFLQRLFFKGINDLLVFVLQTKNCIFLPLFESIFSKERFQFFKFLTNNIWSHFSDYYVSPLKLRCDSRFQHAFTACNCVFKVMTLVGSNQGNYFENTTACSKRTLKTRLATQLKASMSNSKHCLCHTLSFKSQKADRTLKIYGTTLFLVPNTLV